MEREDLSVKNVLYHPRGVYGDDTFHQLYLSDTENHRIVAYTLPHGTFPQINTVAGNGGHYAGPYDNADALTNGLGALGNMWQDTNGIFYIFSFEGNSILKFDPVNKKISTFAGPGQPGTPTDGSPALSTSFYTLSGLWGDSTGLYVADINNRLVLKFSWSDGNPVSIIAGGGNTGVSSTPITATDAFLPGPYGVWGDGSGTLYITDQNACAIYAVNNGQIVLLFGGDCNTFPNDPRNIVGFNQGNSLFLAFASTNGLVITNTDILNPQLSVLTTFGSGIEQIYISPDFSRMYYARSSTNQIFTSTDFFQPGVLVAGSGNRDYSGDGDEAIVASLNQPMGVWQDPSTGNVYVSDQANNRIRVVTDPNPTRRLSEELLTTINTDTPLIASIKALLSCNTTNLSITTTYPSSTTASSFTKHHLRRV